MGKYHWHQDLAKAMEESNGCCVYCKVNLLESRIAYYSITLDHLLPKSKYPKIEAHLENHVLSCNACNSIKRNFDALGEGEDPLQMLQSNRDELIRRAEEFINARSEERNKELDEIRNLIGS
jgi:hypothetical protein